MAPTILEAAGIPEPLSVDGIEQDPLEGVSMLYSFNDAKAAERHETQYFEVMGNRAIYHKGWSAVTKHYTPWIMAPRPALDDDVWELYDASKDWSQAKDLAKEMPQKLHELQRLWLIEAVRYKVLPLDDRMMEKINPDTAGRPVLIKGKTQLLFGGMGHLSENCVLNLKNKSHSVTAEIVVPKGGAEGVIIAQGANIGGWSFYAKGGKLKYCYNWGGYQHFFVEGTVPIPAGEHQVRMEFAYAGGGLGKGGKVTLYTDGQKVGEGDIEATLATIFSADDGCDVGEDTGAVGLPGLWSPRQRLQRPGQGRASGHRRGRRGCGSPDLAGGGHPHGPGAAVGLFRERSAAARRPLLSGRSGNDSAVTMIDGSGFARFHRSRDIDFFKTFFIELWNWG